MSWCQPVTWLTLRAPGITSEAPGHFCQPRSASPSSCRQGLAWAAITMTCAFGTSNADEPGSKVTTGVLGGTTMVCLPPLVGDGQSAADGPGQWHLRCRWSLCSAAVDRMADILRRCHACFPGTRAPPSARCVPSGLRHRGGADEGAGLDVLKPDRGQSRSTVTLGASETVSLSPVRVVKRRLLPSTASTVARIRTTFCACPAAAPIAVSRTAQAINRPTWRRVSGR